MIIKLATNENGVKEYLKRIVVYDTNQPDLPGYPVYCTSKSYQDAFEFNLDDPLYKKIAARYMSEGYYICETRGDFPLRPLKDYEAILLSAI